MIDPKRDVGPFGEPIVTRTLTSEVHGGPVIVAIGKPRLHPTNGRTWLCPWRIEGLDEEPLTGSPAIGVDGWQALNAAIRYVDAALEGTGHPVSFNGGPPSLTE
ncbi:DUF6968 family protein [Nocardia sp. NPDC059240]|uniref:DUF6968 family protein n=1 Tax=Nocardia sp. NPDC059240 TaxID=3346786 RepID=UPI0036C642C2